MTSTFEAVSDALAGTRIFALQPSTRLAIAQRLAAQGITAAIIKRVFAEAVSSYGSPDQARGQFASMVSRAEAAVDLKQVYDELIELEERRRGERGQETASMQFVRADNPYGWKPAVVDVHRLLDTDEPGAWNGHRQCFNMTSSEMLEVPTRDARRFGCSRVEVLGEFDKARVKAGKDIAPDAVWNADVVGVLREAKAVEREIYGS